MSRCYTPTEVKQVLIAIAEYWEAQKPAYQGDESAKRVAERYRYVAEYIEFDFAAYETGQLKPKEAVKDVSDPA